MMENDFAHNSSKDCISKKLKAFVVERRSALCVGGHRLVHQRFLIEAYLVGIEAQHITKSATKLLVLAEREPYRIYQVFHLCQIIKNGRHSLFLILRIS